MSPKIYDQQNMKIQIKDVIGACTYVSPFSGLHLVPALRANPFLHMLSVPQGA